MLRLFIITFLVFFAVPGWAQDLSAVQRELRSRRYYFGPLDGHESAETTAAIREFQKAKALDGTGHADEETLRALGLATQQPQSAESRAQQLGRAWIARYWHACESGEWVKEEPFYAEKLRHYSSDVITRAELREQRLAYYSAWPRRHHVPLLSFATWADGERELWVTARVRHEVESVDGQRRVQTEDLLFKLRARDGDWRAYEISESPPAAPKGLP